MTPKNPSLLEVDGTAVGFIMAIKRNSTVLLWQIGILPQYRRQG
ncbi:MAG: GNAT family N-acetyltransferase [Propionibacteriaceae bacterium]|nr:GNAT family N-acetyltransferase [Propionibacteriaceae bacterium]